MINLISSSPNDTIYYTLDGSEPDETSDIYTSSIEINSTKVLRAKVFNQVFFPAEL